jgi:hypothetical protein
MVPCLTRGTGNVGLRDGRLEMEMSALFHVSTKPPRLWFMPLIGFRSLKFHALNTALQHYSAPLYSDARSMHRKVTIDTSLPPARRMKDSLVRSAFHRTVPVVAVRLPAARTGSVLKSEAMRG